MASPAVPFCEGCVSGSVQTGPTTGSNIVLGTLPCYYAAPPNGLPPAPTVVVLTDIFGHTFVNVQLLADAYARSNLHVLVPDILGGDPVPPELFSSFDEPPPSSIFGQIWAGFSFASKIPTLIPWFLRHKDAHTLPHVHVALTEARRWSQVKGNGRLGAVGFCFGGRYAILSAGEPSPTVDAYAVCHPSNVSVPGDIEQVRRLRRPFM
jgi:dienelactone hydrolase